MKNCRRAIFMVFAMVMASSAVAEEKTLQSPDGRMSVTISDEGGKPVYQVRRGDVTFLEKSPLGVKLNFIDMTEGVTMKACDVKTVKDEYTLKTTKQKS